jgi:hypothetical protein
MTERAATPARRTKRPQDARRGGGPSGRLEVGEYVGQPASDAAQAVRRAGLKPGLERSFGCEAELLGLVVAQEPGAGSELARNGMVTLYVAAPGVSPADEDTDGHAGIDPDPAAAAAAPAVVPQADAPQAPARARRRRKPGLAGTAPQVSDTPPDPVSPERVMAGEAEAPAAETAVTDAWGLETEARAPIPPDGDEYSEGVPDDQWDDELSHDELVVHADDLFAGRVSQELPGWRRVYPRERGAASGRRSHRVRARLAEHPVLASAVGGMLAVWAVVGVAAALASHPARTHTALAPHSGSQAAVIRVPVEPPARKPSAGRSPRQPARAEARPRHDEARPRASRAVLPERAGVRGKGASVQTTPSPRPASPAAPASAPPVAVQEQTQGGLFSP